MIEMVGDVWGLWELLLKEYDVHLCITTNGIVRKDGKAVMGRGIALEAAQKFSWIQTNLGTNLKKYGNNVHYLGNNIFSFPVKHHWRDKADIELIKKSCLEIMDALDDLTEERKEKQKVLLVRPGCGNGGLNWETEVKPLISTLLDDRVIIVSKA